MNRKTEIADNLKFITDEIARTATAVGRDPNDINLIVVTKTFPTSDLALLYELGVRDFGENRDQEARRKAEELPKDINWHFQGVLQSNKIKSIVTWASFIHSISTYDQYSLIEQKSTQVGREVKMIFQINLDQQSKIEQENSGRVGVLPEELGAFFSNFAQERKPYFAGVMGVANLARSASECFSDLVERSNPLREQGLIGPIISAGMSGDFREAIVVGATHLRIGSSILGSRVV